MDYSIIWHLKKWYGRLYIEFVSFKLGIC